MNLRDKSDKEKITSDDDFDRIGLKGISNYVPVGEESDRFFKFSLLVEDEKFIFILRKLDNLQKQVDKLKSENERLENRIDEKERKEFWKK